MAGDPESNFDSIIFPLLYVSSSLSTLGLAFIFIIYYAYFNKKDNLMRMIVYMSFYQVGGTVSWFLNSPDPNPQVCYAGAVLSTFFYVSVFCWYCCLAFNFYHITKRGEEFTEKLHIYYFIISTTIPFICILVPLILDMYSSERIIHEVGCWFSDDFSWARIAFFDGWIFISWIYVTITLILAQREVKGLKAYAQFSTNLLETSRDHGQIVRYLLFNFVMSWTWSAILAIMAIVRDITNEDMSLSVTFVPLLFFSILCPLLPFLNFVVLAWKYPEFHKHWISLMNKIFCFWKTNPSDENFDENEPFNTTNYEPFEESKETRAPKHIKVQETMENDPIQLTPSPKKSSLFHFQFRRDRVESVHGDV